MDYEDLKEDVANHTGEPLLQDTREQILLVPTIDEDVKAMLRKLDEPITMFGEGPGDRRDRLLEIIERRRVNVKEILSDEDEDVDMEEDEEFYTPASLELFETRKFIAEYGATKSRERLQRLKEESKMSLTKLLPIRRAQIEKLKQYELQGSQLVSQRPVSAVAVNEGKILTGSWDGDLTLLDADLNIVRRFETTGKIGGLDWNPQDHTIHIEWRQATTMEPEGELATFDGHTNRIVQSQFHPSGRVIASASYDMTWRLWDVQTQQELLLQEGHSKEVHSLRFHPDGSLLASAGLDALAHVWDLRSGKSIMLLEGHIKAIYALDFRSNGTQIATGSADGSIKIWDMRNAGACVETIPAHSKIVSGLRFHDNYLVSSSYDGKLKIFNNDNWIEVHTLEGHQDKVMSVAVADDFIVSSGWDRSVKKWSLNDLE